MRCDLFFQASCSWAKNVGETGTATGPFFPPEIPSFVLTDRFNTRYDRGDLAGARRQRFLLSGVFPLPFGRGRAFGGNWRGLHQGLLGGWELSTVTLIQS